MNLSKSYQELISCCNHQVLVLDGGFNAVLQRLNLSEADFRGKMFADHFVELKGDNNVLCLTAPDKVKGIHLAFLEAGADLIEANTACASSFGQTKYRLEHMAYDIAKAGAQAACEAVKEFNAWRRVQGKMVTPKFVVGAIASISSVTDFSELSMAYGEQVRGLLDGGADVLLVKSVSDMRNCKAALYAICKECEKRGELFPIMVSGSFAGPDGRMAAGLSAKAFWHSVSSFPIFSIGFNCGLDAADIRSLMRDVDSARVRLSVCADKIIPDEVSVNIVGGCSETTPEAIRTFARVYAARDPRKVPARDYNMLLGGLEPLELAPEHKLVSIVPPGKPGTVVRVDLDGGLADPKAEMPRFLKDLLETPSIAKCPVMIESIRWDTLLSGMENVQGKGIVKSISLKKGEDVFFFEAEEIRRHGFAVVCRAEDEQGPALTYGRRTELMERMYRLLVGRLDFAPEDILFDPVVLPVGTGRDEYPDSAKEFIEACRFVKDNLPHAHVVGDLSLLGYAFKEDAYLRDCMNSVFLNHATIAGMDFGIVEDGAMLAYEEIPLELRHLIEDLLFNRSPEATDALLEYAESSVKKRAGSVGAKIFMPRLEKRFAELKRNLAAKRESLGTEARVNPPFASKFVLASMDSLVHDIDRDILDELLLNYGFPVVDLQQGCNCEKILETLVCEQPDIVYLSAQFTSGLLEMMHVVREFKKQEIGIPLLLGGSAVSDGLVAARIAPEALGPVVYVSDVRKVVKVAEALVDEAKRPAFLEALKAHQKKFRLP
ncbi:MAG: homocysteine S-methyltransferase family protein [Fibrobacter sp.]|nr:homocysteine S-methyltransferase family protein [Fibrobacter sp.]